MTTFYKGLTELELHYHRTKSFVRTKAMDEALRRIDTYHVVIILGTQGAGKSTLGNQILIEMQEKQQALPLKINDAYQFILAINTSRQIVVLIDDMFGQTFLNQRSLEQWLPLLERMDSLATSGRCKLIITTRTCIFNEAKKFMSCVIFSDIRLFSIYHIINLSNEFQLTDVEKMLLFRSFNQTSLNRIRMNEQQILSAHRKYLGLGFPLLCRMLNDRAIVCETELENVLIDSAVQIIDRIYDTEKIEYLTLVFLSLIDSLKLQRCFSVKLTFEEETLLRLLAQTCLLSFSEDLLDRMIDAADCLTGVFLKYKRPQKTFELIDRCVEEAVYLSFGKRSPKIVLKSCSKEFLQKAVTTTTEVDPQQPYLHVQRSQYKVLAERLVAILLSNFDSVNKIAVLGEIDFVNFFFDFLFETNQLEFFLEETVQNPLKKGVRTILFYCEDRPYFLSKLLMQLYGFFKNFPSYDQEINDVLKHFHAQNKNKCIGIIHKFTENKYQENVDCGVHSMNSKKEDEASLDNSCVFLSKRPADSKPKFVLHEGKQSLISQLFSLLH